MSTPSLRIIAPAAQVRQPCALHQCAGSRCQRECGPSRYSAQCFALTILAQRPPRIISNFCEHLVLRAARHLVWYSARSGIPMHQNSSLYSSQSRRGTSFGAHGVVVSHPLRMRKALGSLPSVSNWAVATRPEKHQGPETIAQTTMIS